MLKKRYLVRANDGNSANERMENRIFLIALCLLSFCLYHCRVILLQRDYKKSYLFQNATDNRFKIDFA